MHLEARRDRKQETLAAAFASTIVGWSLASQMAFASVAPPNQGKHTTHKWSVWNQTVLQRTHRAFLYQSTVLWFTHLSK